MLSIKGYLIRIRGAPLLALLLRRAVLVEVVELAAGEYSVVGPLAVCFLGGSLDTFPVVGRLLWKQRPRLLPRWCLETVRQLGHAVSAPRRVGVVPFAPARRARHDAWKRWPHARVGPPSMSSRQMLHCIAFESNFWRANRAVAGFARLTDLFARFTPQQGARVMAWTLRRAQKHEKPVQAQTTSPNTVTEKIARTRCVHLQVRAGSRPVGFPNGRRGGKGFRTTAPTA
jgi:hypothetical protein